MEVVHELHHAQFHAFLVLCRKEPATHHAFHLAKVSSSDSQTGIVKQGRGSLRTSGNRGDGSNGQR